MIDDPKVKQATGLDGLLAGYVLLDPKEGLAFLAATIKDPKEDFLVRYAALRCLRFFWEYREDVLKKPDIVAAVLPLAGMAALPGNAMPSASAIHAMVLAVPITAQVPAVVASWPSIC